MPRDLLVAPSSHQIFLLPRSPSNAPTMASPALRGPSGQKMEKLEIEGSPPTPSSTKPNLFLRFLVVVLAIALCVCFGLHVAAGKSLRGYVGGYVPLEPPLPGVMPGTNARPRIILAQDVDWP